MNEYQITKTDGVKPKFLEQRTTRKGLKILDFIVNLVDQAIPIMNLFQALALKVMWSRDRSKENRIQVEGVIGTMQWNKAFDSIVLAS